MTPEEKAKELIEKFYRKITRAKEEKSFEIALYKNSFEFNRAKWCALLSVEETLSILTYLRFEGEKTFTLHEFYRKSKGRVNQRTK